MKDTRQLQQELSHLPANYFASLAKEHHRRREDQERMALAREKEEDE